jgi:hypothetical protein
MNRIVDALEAGVWGIVFIVAIVVLHAVGMTLTTNVARVVARRAGSLPSPTRYRNALRAAIGIVLGVHAIEVAFAIGYFAWRQDAYTAAAAYRALVREGGDFPLLVHWQLVGALSLASTALWSAIVLADIAKRPEDA